MKHFLTLISSIRSNSTLILKTYKAFKRSGKRHLKGIRSLFALITENRGNSSKKTKPPGPKPGARFFSIELWNHLGHASPHDALSKTAWDLQDRFLRPSPRVCGDEYRAIYGVYIAYLFLNPHACTATDCVASPHVWAAPGYTVAPGRRMCALTA